MLLRILGAFPLRHERIAKRNKRLPDDADHRVECHPGNNGRFLGRSCFGFPRVVPYRLTQSADQIDFETPALTGTLELASSAKINPSGVDRAVPARCLHWKIAMRTSRSTLTGVSSNQWHPCHPWLKLLKNQREGGTASGPLAQVSNSGFSHRLSPSSLIPQLPSQAKASRCRGKFSALPSARLYRRDLRRE